MRSQSLNESKGLWFDIIHCGLVLSASGPVRSETGMWVWEVGGGRVSRQGLIVGAAAHFLIRTNVDKLLTAVNT